jgi:hypothetical protein
LDDESTPRADEELQDAKRTHDSVERWLNSDIPEKYDNKIPIEPEQMEKLRDVMEEFSSSFDNASGNSTTPPEEIPRKCQV